MAGAVRGAGLGSRGGAVRLEPAAGRAPRLVDGDGAMATALEGRGEQIGDVWVNQGWRCAIASSRWSRTGPGLSSWARAARGRWCGWVLQIGFRQVRVGRGGRVDDRH